ncbi:MAG: FAD-dependent oxidoreductase [Nitrospirota bacterium]
MQHLHKKNTTVILGGGLTGLSAGYVLTKAGCSVTLFERDAEVGGLSKTVVHDGFRFDLGGHRFFTKNETIDRFVRDVMDGELISVPRKSKIFMRNKYFDYPLKPMNAAFGLGIPTTIRIIADYWRERIVATFKESAQVSLEDWVVSHFGRTMFNIYFKEYSEKVWGIPCDRISVDWVAQRIRGLSLTRAIKNAFFKFSGKDIPSLVDRFVYSKLGIGRISERLKEEIERENAVHTSTSVERLNYSGSCIESIEVREGTHTYTVKGDDFISSMPLPKLVQILNPVPPRNILDAAARLKFRDLVVVAIMLNRERVTDQTWIYIPEQKIPFGRIHEPTNWSEEMAPKGKTLLVMEFFSFMGDAVWNETDERLTEITVRNLEQLGFIKNSEVIGSVVVRVPKAYPLFEVGYAELSQSLYDYLKRFDNLHLAGRVGMFRYYNMDHALESGMQAAAAVIERMKKRSPLSKRNNGKKPVPASDGTCAAH